MEVRKAMTEIGCPECGQPVEIPDGVDSMPEKGACTHCGHEFFISEAMDLGAETAVLQKNRPRGEPCLDVALVGHLRVTGSMSLEAPSALRPGKTIVGREDADIVATDKISRLTTSRSRTATANSISRTWIAPTAPRSMASSCPPR